MSTLLPVWMAFALHNFNIWISEQSRTIMEQKYDTRFRGQPFDFYGEGRKFFRKKNSRTKLFQKKNIQDKEKTGG